MNKMQLAQSWHIPAVRWAFKLQKEMVSTSSAKQIKHLQEILAFICPQYAKRRGWSQEFVDKLYQESLESLFNTRYAVVRKKTARGKPGSIVATIGLTKAPYGKVVYFNKITQQWEERIGPFGQSYLSAKYSVDRWDQMERLYQHPNWWQWPAPILSFEKNLPFDNRLPRPAVLESVLTSKDFPKDAFTDYFVGMQVDTSKPIYFNHGQILEPTKFAVAKDFENHGIAYANLLTQLFSAVFTSDADPEFNLYGQAFYTYNDRSGIPLYKSMGFETMASQPPQIIGGTSFWSLQLSPLKMLQALSDPAFAPSRMPSELVDYFSNYYQMVAEKELLK